MARFPLSFIPKQDYHYGGIRFGANRSEGKRKHAACDLIAKPGTPIYSVASNGIVLQGPKFFYHGTYSLVIKYPTFVVRYGEIKQEVPPEIYEGATVEEGQLIAHVGKMHNSSMLHFEMYDGSETGPLTVKGNPPYQRRKDLIDPTPYLDTWKLMTQFSNFIDSILDF